MDSSEKGKKRKRAYYKTYYAAKLFSVRSLSLCMSFFVFLLFISSDHSPIKTATFRPVLKVSTFLPSRLISYSTKSKPSPLVVEDRVLFPDHLLLIVSDRIQPTEGGLDCVYYKGNGSYGEVLLPVVSVDEYQELKSIVRCPIPPLNYSAAVELRWQSEDTGRDSRVNGIVVNVPSWDKLVYDAVLDWNTAVVFVKGLNLRPHRESDPRQFRCHFGLSSFGKDDKFVFTTEATTAAQEVVRCLLPRSIRNNTEKAEGIRVTISHGNGGGDDAVDANAIFPSVAKVYSTKSVGSRRTEGKYELCACTMLWNQASFMREWITYHAWLGVQRWFIYDNNSDDGLAEVIDDLNSQDYNVSRHVWPWIKAQEAGFSHCTLRARQECKWVGFFDVDEFFYFPHHKGLDMPGQNSLRALVANYSNSPTYAEIRTICHSFGPSGLTSRPSQGVTIGYTCRLHAPERHKSIVRPELLDITLLNIVHHFKLREGYKYLNIPESTAVVNHYKYQAWDTFKAKFYRRVSTYVTNWQEDHNKGSKDRAPGLGTVAIEPPNWRLRFCEVWDTGLKDFMLANFADPATGFLPWEKSFTSHKSNQI